MKKKSPLFCVTNVTSNPLTFYIHMDLDISRQVKTLKKMTKLLSL